MKKIYQIVMYVESEHYASDDQYIVGSFSNKVVAENVLIYLNRFYNQQNRYINYLESYVKTLIGKTNFDSLWDKLYDSNPIQFNMNLIRECFCDGIEDELLYSVTKIEVEYKYLHGSILSSFGITEHDLL